MTPCPRDKDVFEFVDDALSSSQKKEFEIHLTHCQDCAQLLERLRRQKMWLKKLSSLRTGDTFFLLLMERIRRERLGKKRGWIDKSFPLPRFVPTVVFTLFVIACTGFFLWLEREKTTSRNVSSVFPSLHSSLKHEKVHYVLDELPRSHQTVSDRSSLKSMPPAPDSLLSEENTLTELASHLRPVSF